MTLTASSAMAQPLGTFRWQIQPHCNVLTINVVQQAGIYTLDGTDDRCGEAQAASVVGIAFLNPGGSVGFGMTVVLPGGTPVHIESTIDTNTLSGTWRDSGGNTGRFAFTPGPGVGGTPRLVPSGGLPINSVTAVHIVPGAVGAAALALDAVSGGNIVDLSITTRDILDPPGIAFSSGDQVETFELECRQGHSPGHHHRAETRARHRKRELEIPLPTRSSFCHSRGPAGSSSRLAPTHSSWSAMSFPAASRCATAA